MNDYSSLQSWIYGGLTVFATLVSPLIAVGVTRWRDEKAAEKERKERIFRILMATRRIALNPDHVHALNSIEVAFYGCEKVIKAWKDYLLHLNSRTPDEEWVKTKETKLSELLYAISLELGYSLSSLDIFNGGYAPGGWATRENNQDRVLAFLSDVATKSVPVPLSITHFPVPEPPNDLRSILEDIVKKLKS
jgi:hypothetical protein